MINHTYHSLVLPHTSISHTYHSLVLPHTSIRHTYHSLVLPHTSIRHTYHSLVLPHTYIRHTYHSLVLPHTSIRRTYHTHCTTTYNLSYYYKILGVLIMVRVNKWWHHDVEDNILLDKMSVHSPSSPLMSDSIMLYIYPCIGWIDYVCLCTQ